ncbi:MAG TPA: VWA domain-containing protein [Polyangia bacterium]
MTSASRMRRTTKRVLVLVGIAAGFATLARPQWGFRWEEERREGVDLMFAVDTSKSMRATDMRPDRLTRAKLAVSDLLREFPGERVGLIAFAGEAFVQAPMTIDHAVFGESLDALDSDTIPRGGTDIASAIRAAAQAMATEPDRRKVLVLLSDGEDLQGETLAAATEAAHAGLVIYTVGVGTPAGELIPVGRDGQRDVMRDSDGQPVHSRLDEGTLRRVAETTGGAYAALGPAGRGLELLYRQHLSRLPTRTVEERTHKVYTERFQIPLALAISCLLLELAIGERARRRGAGGQGATGGNSRGETGRPGHGGGRLGPPAAVTTALAALLVMTAPGAATAATPPVAPPADGVATYNEGTSAYRKKDFSAAQDRFLGATRTTDVAMQEDAYYDLGNARYRLGQASLAKDRPATIAAWKSAVAAYDGALALQKQDADARFNRDLVARRLAALEDQERQDKQNKQNQQNQKQQQASSKDSPSANGQGQKDKPQQGQGQPKQGQGQSAAQNGGGQSPPDSDGKGAGAQAGKRDQKPGQGQPQQAGAGTPGQAPQPLASEGASPGDAPKSGKPGERQDTRAGDDQTGPPKPGTTEGAAASEEPKAPSQGPGVVTGPNQASAARGDDASVRRAPGALSAREATQLLDSVSGELRRMPVASGNRHPRGDNDSPTKDW